MWFMDSLKDFGNKVKQKANEAIDSTAKSIQSSKNFSVNNKEELDNLIKKSANTEFQNKETWEIKTFKHKSIIIIIDENTEFYKKTSLLFPILSTKTFSKSINIKLSKKDLEWVDYVSEFEIEEFPAMIVFEDEKIYKKIIWEENIEKIIKSVKIDIEEQIEQF